MMDRVRVIVWSMLVLALLGVADAGYLTYDHFRGSIPPCTIAHGCTTVLTSPYATVAGIPVALFGALFYATVAALAAFVLATQHARVFQLLVLVAPLGFLASLWFVYLQLFVLKAICTFCMASAVTSTLLFVCTLVLLRGRRNAPPTPTHVPTQ